MGEAGGRATHAFCSFHCPKLNCMVKFNHKGAGNCSLPECQAWGPIPCFCLRGSCAVPFSFFSCNSLGGLHLTFPPPLERQLFSREQPPPPTRRTRIEQQRALLWLPTIKPISVSCISEGCFDSKLFGVIRLGPVLLQFPWWKHNSHNSAVRDIILLTLPTRRRNLRYTQVKRYTVDCNRVLPAYPFCDYSF